MLGSSNTSFIPKHTANKVERKNTPRRLFLGTLIVRVLFFAVLIVAVGVFAYERRLGGVLLDAQLNLDSATQSFDRAEMERVISFDNRLKQANEKWREAASVLAILESLESSVLSNVQLTALDLLRQEGKIEVSLALLTDNYDAVIQQRQTFSQNPIFAIKSLDNVSISLGYDQTRTGLSSNQANQNSVVFDTVLITNQADVRYVPSQSTNNQLNSQSIFTAPLPPLAGDELISEDTNI